MAKLYGINPMDIFNHIVEIFIGTANAMEPYQGSVNMTEGQYTAMQGIIHFIGWSIAIAIIVFFFRYMKKHAQQDERYKKYIENKKEEDK